MAFFEVTYNRKYRFATLHNFGCSFRCPVCSYKLRSGPNGPPGLSFPRPERFLSIEEMEKALRSVSVDKVYFMGGEPTTSKDLQEMLDFAKNDLGIETFLGHTNGSRLPLPNLDGANVGLKAWDETVHLQYTGRSKKEIYDNFEASVRAGMRMKANVVLVPGLVGIDQVERVAEWLAKLDPSIPFHIAGYIPVPGQPYRPPEREEMVAAVEACRPHLRNVGSSLLTAGQALDLAARDDRFAVERIA
ncbi:MAG TPA: radical SAM protein [Methanomassiliicoccales archaeon]|nr:radical SAM protein [Methanomassiliicoccales archaeon]